MLSNNDLTRAEEYARRLLEIAQAYEAHKYIAVAHKLLGEIYTARGDFMTAEAELKAALAELETYPVPVVEWKTHASLAHLRMQAGDSTGAQQSFNQAGKIVAQIASAIADAELRALFLNSAAVRDITDRMTEEETL